MDIMDTETIHSLEDSEPLPDWLTAGESQTPKMSKEAKALSPIRHEAVFPRVMDKIAEGWNMTDAIADLPVEVNVGAFRRWVKRDPMRVQQLKDAEELRSEVWADRMMSHALGHYEMEDVARSKLVVDAYKWRIIADNRRKYGETKQIEVGGQISVIAALAAAEQRVIRIIDKEEPMRLEE